LRASAILERLNGLRWPLLGLALFVCAGLGIALFPYRGALAASGSEAAAIALVTGLAALWLTQSLVLAGLAVGAVAVSTVFAFGILTPVAEVWPSLCGVLVPHAMATVLLAVAGVALFVAQRFARGLAGGATAERAAGQALDEAVRPGVAILALVALWRVVLWLPAGVTHVHREVATTDVSLLAAMATAIPAGVAALILLPLALGAVPFGEGTCIRVNRVGEFRARMIDELRVLTVWRWALASVGIAVVFTALTIFGAGRAAQAPDGMAGYGFVLVLAGVGAAVLVRDWRAVLTCTVPAALGALWGVALARPAALVVLSRTVTLPGVAPGDVLMAAATLSAAGSYLIAARAAAHRETGAGIEVALAYAVMECVPSLVAIVLVAAVVLIPLGLWRVPLACGLAMIVLTPAVATVVEGIFPKLRSFEELYGNTRVEPR
jgi:hypothetical protein